jgi:hypothetical protein
MYSGATMRRVACTALALCFIAGCASTQSGGPVLTVAGTASGRFDSNVQREPTARSAYGAGGEMLVRAANGVRAPTLQLEYATGMRHSEPKDPGDGVGHRLNVLAGAPLSSWLRMDALLRASRGGVDEDLSPANEIAAVGRIDFQLAQLTRLRGYGAHKWREVAGSPDPALGRYGGLEVRQRFGRSTTLLVDARYEELEPPDATRSWERISLALGVGQSIFRNTAFELELRGRERTYPDRMVAVGEALVPRRDEDVGYGVALVYDNGSGTELRLAFERESRRSSDVTRTYGADRVNLLVRRRAFALGGRRDPPRIDERPGTDAIRATFPDSVPLAARALSNVVVAGAGVCALAEAGALCWSVMGTEARPVVLQGRWRQASAAAGRVCGLDESGGVHCWSWNSDPRTARGTSVLNPPVPLRTELRFVKLTVGAGHACGLTAEGAAYCWGGNADGQLGNGLAIPSPSPVAVTGELRFRDISAGEHHTCALDEAGAVFCWGSNQSGQAAAGTLRRTLWPRRVEERTFTAVAAGQRHTCGLTADGQAWCWGENGKGQAGLVGGGVAGGAVPVPAAAQFVAISAGWAHTCALATDGRAWCWGSNRNGQLGTGQTDEDPHPEPVAIAGEREFTGLSASFRTCALDGQQNVYCWGGSGLHPDDDVAAARPRRLSTRLR